MLIVTLTEKRLIQIQFRSGIFAEVFRIVLFVLPSVMTVVTGKGFHFLSKWTCNKQSSKSTYECLAFTFL